MAIAVKNPEKCVHIYETNPRNIMESTCIVCHHTKAKPNVKCPDYSVPCGNRTPDGVCAPRTAYPLFECHLIKEEKEK